MVATAANLFFASGTNGCLGSIRSENVSIATMHALAGRTSDTSMMGLDLRWACTSSLLVLDARSCFTGARISAALLDYTTSGTVRTYFRELIVST